MSAFISDHIDAEEVYQLGQADLEFGELLPEKPGWMKQDEHEERRRVMESRTPDRHPIF